MTGKKMERLQTGAEQSRLFCHDPSPQEEIFFILLPSHSDNDQFLMGSTPSSSSVAETSPNHSLPNHQRWYARWKLSCNI